MGAWHGGCCLVCVCESVSLFAVMDDYDHDTAPPTQIPRDKTILESRVACVVPDCIRAWHDIYVL